MCGKHGGGSTAACNLEESRQDLCSGKWPLHEAWCRPVVCVLHLQECRCLQRIGVQTWRRDGKSMQRIGGCKTIARANGRCKNRHQGCKPLPAGRGRCTKHGAQGRCIVDGCTTRRRQGFEHGMRHGGVWKPCAASGGLHRASSKHWGLCGKDGGGGRRQTVNVDSLAAMAAAVRRSEDRSGCIAPATPCGANCTKHAEGIRKQV